MTSTNDRRLPPMFVAALTLAAAAQASPVPNRPDVVDSSTVGPSGERIMREEILIKAPRAEVWKAVASSEGWKSWAMPLAELPAGARSVAPPMAGQPVDLLLRRGYDDVDLAAELFAGDVLAPVDRGF